MHKVAKRNGLTSPPPYNKGVFTPICLGLIRTLIKCIPIFSPFYLFLMSLRLLCTCRYCIECAIKMCKKMHFIGSQPLLRNHVIKQPCYGGQGDYSIRSIGGPVTVGLGLVSLWRNYKSDNRQIHWRAGEENRNILVILYQYPASNGAVETVPPTLHSAYSPWTLENKGDG